MNHLILQISIILLCVSFSHGVKKISAEDLLKKIDRVRILDLRSEYQRELDGFISQSELLSKENNGEFDQNVYG